MNIVSARLKQSARATEKRLDTKMPDQPNTRPEHIDVVWIGDPATAQQTLARRAPHISITPKDARQALEGLRAGGLRADLLVIDASFRRIDRTGASGYEGEYHRILFDRLHDRR